MKPQSLLAACVVLGSIAMLPTVRAQPAAAPQPPAMETTASGLKYAITTRGTGPAAKPGQVVIAHYVGSLLDGMRFDSSRDRGQPFAFTLGQGRVIKGWDEGFALLRVGDKATFLIPPTLAYGARKAGPIPPNSTLRFEVELIDIKDRALADALQETLDAAGADAAQQKFETLRAGKFEGLHVGEDQLNALGYARLRQEKGADAIMVFQWNVALFPYSPNVHDSLGEAYAKAGQRALAIQSYEKSLALDPKNANAAKALAELRKPGL